MKVMTPAMLSQLNASSIPRLQVQVSSSGSVNTNQVPIQILTTVNGSPLISSGSAQPSILPAFTKIMTPSPGSATTLVTVSSLMNCVPAITSSNSSVRQKDCVYTEMEPVIKTEPKDDSYDYASKLQASKEALGNLKNVLGVRNTERQTGKKAIPPYRPPPRLSYPTVNASMPVQVIGTPGPGNSMSNYRFVPVGPPVALPNVQLAPVRIPGLSVPGLIPVSSSVPVWNTAATMGNSATVTAMQPAQTDVATSSQASEPQSNPGGPVVVNAKSVGAPMNGQLLTLPPAVAKRLSLNKSLALKINNKQINVLPSGFFQSSEGLKVFLPPNTFPNEAVNLAVSDVVKSPEDNTGQKPDSQSDAVSSKSKSDIRHCKHYSKCCLIQKLYGGFDAMEHIFKYLPLTDLLRLVNCLFFYIINVYSKM